MKQICVKPTSCFFPSDTSSRSTQRPLLSALLRLLPLLLARLGGGDPLPPLLAAAAAAGPWLLLAAESAQLCRTCTTLGATRTPSISVPARSSCSCLGVGSCGRVTQYSCQSTARHITPWRPRRFHYACLDKSGSLLRIVQRVLELPAASGEHSTRTGYPAPQTLCANSSRSSSNHRDQMAEAQKALPTLVISAEGWMTELAQFPAGGHAGSGNQASSSSCIRSALRASSPCANMG